MPGIDGLSVIREAKRLKADLPVIIITGYSTETAAIEAVNLGVSGYLTKPFRVPAGARRGCEGHRGACVSPSRVLQLSSITKSFGERVLLEDVTWQITSGERVGLCGPNGAGKTTLLKMMAGFDGPDEGQIIKPSALTVGYLPQDGLNHAGRSILDEASSAFADLLERQARDARDRGAARRPIGAVRGARGDARALQRAAGSLSHRRGIQHRSEGGDGASRARLHRRDVRAAHRLAVGRMADAAGAREAAARPADAAAARRADQPPRSRSEKLARGISVGVSARRHPRLARSVLPRRGRHAHHRSEPSQADGLSGQLLALHRRARRAHGAAAQVEARAGRRDRARQDVHRSVPVPGDEGGAGAEPHQDARQGRADRGAARAQAHPFHVSGVREERALGARAARRAQGVRRQGDLLEAEPADRARRPHRAGRPERRRQIDADADALGGGNARRRARGARGIRS